MTKSFCINFKRTYCYLSVIITVVLYSSPAYCQNPNLDIFWTPDLWFNEVDGFVIGALLKAEVVNGYDNSHRTMLGVWLGTNIPDVPVSYHFKYENGLNLLSEPQREFTYSFESMYRFGLLRNSFGIKKRFQIQDDEFRYYITGLSLNYHNQNRPEYLIFPDIYKKNEKVVSSQVFFNTYYFDISSDVGLNNNIKRIQISYKNGLLIKDRSFLNYRLYGYLTNKHDFAEYRTGISSMAPVGWYQSKILQAGGTFPISWLTNGNYHYSGGGGLRGYEGHDYTELKNNGMQNYPLQILTSSIDFGYRLHYTEITEFRVYGFTDIGSTFGTGYYEEKMMVSAGAGLNFSFNIADHLAQTRGFIIRLESPFWLSSAFSSENNLKFRTLLSFSSHFNL